MDDSYTETSSILSDEKYARDLQDFINTNTRRAAKSQSQTRTAAILLGTTFPTKGCPSNKTPLTPETLVFAGAADKNSLSDSSSGLTDLEDSPKPQRKPRRNILPPRPRSTRLLAKKASSVCLITDTPIFN